MCNELIDITCSSSKLVIKGSVTYLEVILHIVFYPFEGNDKLANATCNTTDTLRI